MSTFYENLLKTTNPKKKSVFPYLWHGISIGTWFILYTAYQYFLFERNEYQIFILFFALTLVIFAVFQQALISKLIKIFPYWFFSDLIGFILGFLYVLFFIWALFTFVLQAGIIITSMKSYLGIGNTIYLMTIVILTTTGFVFFLFTYGFWEIFVNPLIKSHRINEKIKLSMDNVIIIVFSIYSAITLLFSFLLIFNSNMLISTFLSSLAFSYITHSGFKEIYIENSILKPFDNRLLPSNRNFWG